MRCGRRPALVAAANEDGGPCSVKTDCGCLHMHGHFPFAIPNVSQLADTELRKGSPYIIAFDSKYVETLDKFSSCYPMSGDAALKKPFSVEYKWQKKRSGDLLMLAHPLHAKLLSYNHDVTVLNDFKYRSIDGDLVGVVGDSWVLETNPIHVTWNSNKGVEKESYGEIVTALDKNVQALNSSAIGTNSSYFYGKQVGRATRLALIAEEVSYPKVIPKVKKFLKETIEPWLDGTFKGNAFLYERKWRGLVTKHGSTDSTADFGFGIYNDHHFHLGYFIYGIAVLAKIDPQWGQKCFDLYNLHSWAAGLTEFEDGRNQESTSEAAYYAGALLGLAYGDSSLVDTGSTLVALEILAAQTWWHVKAEDNLECRLGIQVLPLLPITETLFSDAAYVKELVEWIVPFLSSQGWKGMTYALQGIYDKKIAQQMRRRSVCTQASGQTRVEAREIHNLFRFGSSTNSGRDLDIHCTARTTTVSE
ncbi:putative endo-1,3(4)-beta-glucanase [Glycine soja]|uniref:glucan endo-1,3-beta-D-glucosidase n=1 Tax=Glycine soja TaxID=3848 RepID=A0A445GW14_GLYSO|nr:putative endo-1,3(4)-beta-glucanase [Glycine soja]